MTSRKICMLGDFAVGKTSLVRRFVDEAFSEKYLTTVGVKIDTKLCQTDHGELKLVIWDIAGAADVVPLQKSYIQGMAGYLLVCDGTRLPTLTSVKSIQRTLAESGFDLPFLLLINKSDLKESTEVEDADLDELRDQGWTLLRTSAKTGDQVEQAFQILANALDHAQTGPQ